MQQGNQVGSYTTAHKGLLEYLSDQVMAQLSTQDGDQAPSAVNSAQTAEAEAGDRSSSFFFNTGRPGCTCPRCAVMRRLV